MTTYIRNPLTIVWALLSAVTIASWLTARDGGATHQINVTVTVVVLLLAGLKAQLVIWHFMEVRTAPRWLKVVTSAWVVGLFTLLLGSYFATL